MQIRISELKLPADHGAEEPAAQIRRILRVKDTPEYKIVRRSLDARKKPALFYVYTIDVTLPDKDVSEKKRAALLKDSRISLIKRKDYVFPIKALKSDGDTRPVIVGSGPAGLFCALMLARAGLCPLVIERGESVDKRAKTVAAFWEGGKLDPSSNVQFGEGGAGTFSDGKLNTSVKDPKGRIRFVLEEFVKAGAPESILYDYRPHLGTDLLMQIVKNFRREIISLGGQFRFSTCLTGIAKTEEGYRLELDGGKEYLKAKRVVLAIGHSARDTYQLLYDLGFSMEAKSFAVGLRMEHSQRFINEAFYGREDPGCVGAATYRLSHRCENGRGVYSFCMCPGGYVVNASSEPAYLAVNGMSYSGRASENANSALVVTVTPEDYGSDAKKNPLSGVAFQRELEKRAFSLKGGRIPLQRFKDFCDNTPSTGCGAIRPQMKGIYAYANLRGILPEELNLSLIEGLKAFGEMTPGFDDPDLLLSGVESRTSAPLRILRDENGVSLRHPGIYPCGEGAGYAGGIVSAAADGIRCAENIVAALK